MKYRILRKSSTPFDKVHEECGVFGIAAPEGKEISAAHDAYTALFALQHRGQEAAGIAVNKNGVIHCHKDVGLVSSVFDQKTLDRMPGSMAIGHVRYSTTGDTRRENAQPISITHVKGNLAVAHNGNLVNAGELRREIELDGGIFRSSNDTEVLVYTIVKERLKCASIEEAVLSTMKRIEGAYSLVVMSPRKLIAARDPHGFRPLCIGLLDGDCYVFASETCALDALGAKFIRDVEPGEVCVVENGKLRSMHCDIECKTSACVFEYIYFARPDSIIDGASVELARQEAGKYLSIEHPVGADVVIGVPDSGIPAAIGYANTSKRPVRLELRPETTSGALRTDYPKQIAPGERGEINFTYLIPADKPRYGTVRDALEVLIDGRSNGTTLVTHGIGVDPQPADATQNAPKADFSENILKFGPVKHAGPVRKKHFTLSNAGGAELIVRAVEGEGHVATTLAPGQKIAPGDSLRCEILLDPRTQDYGIVTEHLVVVTNDPVRPMRRIRVTAIIEE